MIDNRTPALDLPLPHPDNDLEQDVTRLRAALMALDTIVAAKANGADIHAALAALIGIAPPALDTLAELAAALDNDPNFATTIMGLIGAKAAAEHGHAIADVDGLPEALSTIPDASAIAAAVAGKADKTGAIFSGAILFSGEHDNGNSGTAKTINFGLAQNHKLLLDANCTLTFTAPAGVYAGRLRVVKDATTTTRSITWPAGTRFLSGATVQAPNNTAGAVAMYFVYYDGTSWWVSGGRF